MTAEDTQATEAVRTAARAARAAATTSVGESFQAKSFSGSMSTMT